MSEPVDIGPLRVTSYPLPFEKAQPHIPVIGQLLAIGVREIAPIIQSGKVKGTDDLLDPKVMLALSPAIQAVMEFLDQNGRLEKLVSVLLGKTVVVMDGTNYEMLKPKDRADVFNAHPEHYFQILFHAGRTTYARFFPAIGQSDGDTPTQ